MDIQDCGLGYGEGFLFFNNRYFYVTFNHYFNLLSTMECSILQESWNIIL